MPVKFNPSGNLDVATDPSDLPVEVSGKTAICPSMTRCTNLHQDRAGVVSTRWGSSKIGAAAVGTPVHLLVEQDGDRYAFGGSAIYKNEVSIGSGYTSAAWSAVKYNAYNVTVESLFAVNGTDRKRITGSTVAEWGITAPSVAPTAAGNITGYAYTYDWEGTYHATANSYQFGTETDSYQTCFDWEENVDASDDSETYRNMWWFEVATGRSPGGVVGVKYTYCRKSDDGVLECESNPSDAVYIEAGSGVYVTWTASSDSQVTHVRLYRTLAGGGDFYYSHEVPIGTTSDAMDVQDGSLGSEIETDHDRPPLGTVVIGPDFNGYLFMLKDNLLYYCKPKQPEYWPANYYIEVSPLQDPLTGAVLINGQVYVLTQSEVYLVQGTGYQSFFPLRQAARTGALAHRGIVAVRGKGIFRIANDGLWAFQGADDENLTNAFFRPIFIGTTVGAIPGINRTYASRSWILLWKNKLYHAFPGGAETYPGQILVTDLQTGKTQHYDYGADFSCAAVDITNDRIILADTSGYIWTIETPTATTDNGTAISWDYQSGEVSDQVRQYFPRSAKYDVEVGSGATATAHVMLDGSSAQSHTLSGSRNTTKRLVTTCTGKRLQCRITGTGAVSIWGAELE